MEDKYQEDYQNSSFLDPFHTKIFSWFTSGSGLLVFWFRENDNIKFTTTSPTIGVDVFDVGIGVEFEDLFGEVRVVVRHEKDTVSPNDRLLLDDFHIGYSAVG